MGFRDLPERDQPQIGVQHEAAPGPEGDAETAWFMQHRLREVWKQEHSEPFDGPAEADETFFGGKRQNMSKDKRKALKGAGTGYVGKTIVAGIKDRATNRISAAVVPDTTAKTLSAFVESRTKPDATVYTDEHSAYTYMRRPHESVRHGAGEYVRGDAHTQGIESFWAMLKRAHKGTFHKISPKHLQRYVTEFAGKHGIRDRNTIDQMQAMVAGMVGKRLLYTDLIAD